MFPDEILKKHIWSCWQLRLLLLTMLWKDSFCSISADHHDLIFHCMHHSEHFRTAQVFGVQREPHPYVRITLADWLSSFSNHFVPGHPSQLHAKSSSLMYPSPALQKTLLDHAHPLPQAWRKAPCCWKRSVESGVTHLRSCSWSLAELRPVLPHLNSVHAVV